MLKHQMQKRYMELSSRFEGGKRERGNIGNETNLVQAHANCERERMQAGGDWASTNR